MSLNILCLDILCLDILKILANYCNALSILRLTRVCKRLRNIINDKFLDDLFKSNKNIWDIDNTLDGKSKVLIRDILELKVKLVRKYEYLFIDNEFTSIKPDEIDMKIRYLNNKDNKKKWNYNKSIRQIERNQYKYLCSYFKKYNKSDEILKEINKLHKNLLWIRKSKHLLRREFILSHVNIGRYNYDIRKVEEIYSCVKPDTIIIFPNIWHVYRTALPRRLLIRKTKGRKLYWKNVTSRVKEYLLNLKDSYCIGKNEFQELYNFPFILREEFDYI